MVTIRRINVPHAEPQVTVTAKGISPDKDKLLYTFINGQLIPSANLSNAGAVKQMKQTVKVEPTANAKNVKKAAETPTDKTTKKNVKENKVVEKKPSDKSRKASPENPKPSVSKERGKPATAPAPAKEKEKPKQKKGKKDVESEINAITKSTKEMTIAEEKPKKEKKKVKAVKFEYADPNYKVNQFDLLDMDEDDDYYTESSTDESSEEESIPKPTPIEPKVQNPPLSKQSSVESQHTQPPVQNNKSKNQSTTKTATATAKVSDTTKKSKSDAPAKAQPQKSDKKATADVPPAKAQKSQSNPAPSGTAAAAKPVDESNLSKKQKKKLTQKQTAAQQQPNAAKSKAVILHLPYSIRNYRN